MNPDLPHISREELEVRLTALLLGELPPAEAEAVRQLAAHDPELGRELARLEQAIQLVREGVAKPGELGAESQPPPLKLAPEKRTRLLAHLKQPVASATPAPAPARAAVTPEAMGVKRLPSKRGKFGWLVPVGVGMALVTVLAGLMLPALSSSKQKSRKLVAASAQRMDSLALGIEPVPAPKNPVPVTLSSPEPQVERQRTAIVLPPASGGEADANVNFSSGYYVTTRSGRESTAGVGGGGGAGRRDDFDSGLSVPPTDPVKLGEPGVNFSLAGSTEAPMVANNSFVASRQLNISGVSGVKGVRKAELQPATPAPAAGQTPVVGDEVVGHDFAINLPSSSTAWGFENRDKVVAGKAVDADAKAEVEVMRKRVDRGTVSEPQFPTTGLPPAADHFYADTDGLALDGTRLANRGEAGFAGGAGSLHLAAKALSPPAQETESLLRAGKAPTEFGVALRDATVEQRRAGRSQVALGLPADPEGKMVPGKDTAPAFFGSMTAGGVVAAPTKPASPAAANQLAGTARLPMPTMKGTPEDLPTGANIEGLADTEAQQRANWDVLEKKATKEVAASAPASPPATLAPEAAERFARRYGISPPSGKAASAAKDDRKQPVSTLGDEAVVGAFFKQKAGEKAGEPVAGGRFLYSMATTNAVAVQLGRSGGRSDGQQQWFDAGGVGQAAERFEASRGRAIVLPGINGQVVDGNANAATGGEELHGNLALGFAFQPTAPASQPDFAGRALTGSRDAGEINRPIAEEQAGKAPVGDVSYAAKKRELDEKLRFRNTLALKSLSEKVDTAMPKLDTVEIVDSAKPGKPSASLWERAKRTVTGAPDQYISTARIRAEREVLDIDPTGGMPNAAGAYDPYFIQTESEVIQSKQVLGAVVSRLKLSEEWGKKDGTGTKLNQEEALQLLRKKIELQPVEKTYLVEVKVKSDSPEEAARIANAVAEAYHDYRKESGKQFAKQQVEALTRQSEKTDQEIAELEQELKKLEVAAPAAEPPAPPKPPADAPIPQPEISTAENAFSTFSLNVADVSFKLAQASLEKGQMPDAASVRSEEFINAFDYRDPEPAPGAPVGFAWERARFPFAHNRDALRFSVKTAAAGRQAGRPLNLVLLLDNSGSMERADRVNIIREALRVLASQLQPQDRVSVVTFARTPRLWVDGMPGSEASQLVERVGNLAPQGGTDLGAALALGYETALRHYLPGGMNRLVLLTDGAANLGDVDPASLRRRVEQHRKQGIALDGFGIGWEGYNDDLLESLTRNGDGRYGFVNTPEAAATEFAAQLAGALQVAASDVKVQVEFNPARVTNWRQVGYAKHQLTKEQFRDNTVDAAEIAAQEAGNGLYVIEVNPAGQGDIATVRVRYKVPGTTDYRELEWPVPFNGSAVPLAMASPAMRLMVASASFSEWLARSPFSAEVSPDALLRQLAGVPEVYGADGRPKKLEWMIHQAKSITGK